MNHKIYEQILQQARGGRRNNLHMHLPYRHGAKYHLQKGCLSKLEERTKQL